MKSCSVAIQMKATEQYVPVVLFITLYKVFLTFESVDEILWCVHSNGTSLTVHQHGANCFAERLWSILGVKGKALSLE